MSDSQMSSGPAPQVRLGDFEKKIRLRQLTMEDYPALIAMQKLCFPGMGPWGEDRSAARWRFFLPGRCAWSPTAS